MVPSGRRISGMTCVSRISKDVSGFQFAQPMTGIDMLRMVVGLTDTKKVGIAAVGFATVLKVAARTGSSMARLPIGAAI